MNKILFSVSRLIRVFAIITVFTNGLALQVCGQSPSRDEKRQDFIKLLDRPRVARAAVLKLITNDSLQIQSGYFYSEPNEKVPVVIYRPAGNHQRLPLVICLHGTGGSKDDQDIRALLASLCHAGFMAVAIDGRFHGERAKGAAGQNPYTEAITAAWRNKDVSHQTHPFYFDTVYDLWRLIDWLDTRSDIDTARIGMIGISKGGIETWMAAATDPRIKVAVPVIAVQSFRWSWDNDRWQGRAHTIWAAHVAAAKDLGDTGVNKNNVLAVWNKLLPGITNEFDCPSMLPLIAPRPLLVLSTENDQNCPLPGARIAFDSAMHQYQLMQATDRIKMDVEPNQPHRFTDRHRAMAIAWFKSWL